MSEDDVRFFEHEILKNEEYCDPKARVIYFPAFLENL